MGVAELIVVATLVLSPLWLIAVLDIAYARFADGATRLVWVMIVIFVPFGCILYLVSGRQRVVSGGLGFLHRG